jgi:OmpA-OmpF porin, OOP family
MRFIKLLTIWLFSISVCWAGVPTKDVPKSKDPAGLPRYSGSVIFGYEFADFDESNFPVGKAFFTDKRGFEKTLRAEGKRTRVLYLAPEGRSSLEVMRNYTDTLTKAGYKPIFECARDTCGVDVEDALYASNKQKKLEASQVSAFAFTMGVSDQRLFVAELKQGGASSYVMVFAAASGNAAVNEIKNRVTVYVEQIQAGQMENRMETVKSSEIQQAMTRDGKVAIYGVLFDTDKADIKPASTPQLEEMGRYLQQNPSVAVYIVGHTDNQGKLDYNLSLSQRRADAVVNALATTYKIARTRLVAKGVAGLSPVASNQAEEGRAKNRRVELVLQ